MDPESGIICNLSLVQIREYELYSYYLLYGTPLQQLQVWSRVVPSIRRHFKNVVLREQVHMHISYACIIGSCQIASTLYILYAWYWSTVL